MFPGRTVVYWSGREDLNLRPPAPKAGALPGCATPRHPKLLFYRELQFSASTHPIDGVNPKNETLGKAHYAGKGTASGKETKDPSGAVPKGIPPHGSRALKSCDDIVALSRELGVHRRLLYKWRDQLDPAEIAEESPPQTSRESTLRKEVNQLKRLLAEKTVEVDFFKGALQKVEARRQRRGSSGETASTTRSKK